MLTTTQPECLNARGTMKQRYFGIFHGILNRDHPKEPNDLNHPMWTGKTEANETFCHSVFQT